MGGEELGVIKMETVSQNSPFHTHSEAKPKTLRNCNTVPVQFLFVVFLNTFNTSEMFGGIFASPV